MSNVTLIQGTITIEGREHTFTIEPDYNWATRKHAAPYVMAMVQGLADEELLHPEDERTPAPWESGHGY